MGLPPPWGPVGPPCSGELQPPPPQAWNHPWDCVPWGSAPPCWVWGHPGELQPPRFGDTPGIRDTLGRCSPPPGWDRPWDRPPWGPPPLPGLGPSLGSALGICSLPGTSANRRLRMPLGICAPSQAWSLPGDWGLQGSAPSETPWESRSPPHASLGGAAGVPEHPLPRLSGVLGGPWQRRGLLGCPGVGERRLGGGHRALSHRGLHGAEPGGSAAPTWGRRQRRDACPVLSVANSSSERDAAGVPAPTPQPSPHCSSPPQPHPHHPLPALALPQRHPPPPPPSNPRCHLVVG